MLQKKEPELKTSTHVLGLESNPNYWSFGTEQKKRLRPTTGFGFEFQIRYFFGSTGFTLSTSLDTEHDRFLNNLRETI